MRECLVIIDVQKGFLSEPTKGIPKKIEALLKTQHFEHIVCTQYYNHEGSPYVDLMGWRGFLDRDSRELHPFVEKISERVFKKDIYSCFTSEFDTFIKGKRIDKLFFLGIDTDCCVLKSCMDCFERNIPFEVLINYCASNGGEESHKAALAVMKRTIGENCMNVKL